MSGAFLLFESINLFSQVILIPKIWGKDLQQHLAIMMYYQTHEDPLAKPQNDSIIKENFPNQ